MFYHGKKHGDNCIYEWRNGKKYVGSFRDGYMNGQGILTMNNS